MHWIDWAVVIGFTLWIVYDGLKRTRDSGELAGYFLAHRSIPWWAAGLSVMATQLSAITMIGTTGQGYNDGMRFIQFYYGLPIAMIILSVTLVPFFYRSGVYTAYEYLEQRFDAKTRSLTSLLFLLSRGMSVGAVVSAPAVVLSLVLGWDLTATALLITLPAVVYTMFGGVQAVTWTDVKIMALIVVGLFAMIAAAVIGLPSGIGLADGLGIAASTGRLRSFEFSWDLTNQYTVWSGTIAALFLFCSYFGTDQSQVQRYLTARSEAEAKRSLLMSAYWKIPLQVLVLLLGVLVFVFYVFNTPPLLFSGAQAERLRESPAAAQYAALEGEFGTVLAARRTAGTALAAARDTGDDGQIAAARDAFVEANNSVSAVRSRALSLVRDTTGDRTFTDVNYIIPTFILMRNLGLMNTHEALWIPGLISVFGIFLLRQFFLRTPRDLEEAAKLDGAGYLRIMFQIALPLAAPAIVALGVLNFQAAWNDFFAPNLFLTTPDKFTLPVGLVALRGMFGGTPTTIFAGVTMVLVPVLIVFLLAQRRLTESIALTGIRG